MDMMQMFGLNDPEKMKTVAGPMMEGFKQAAQDLLADVYKRFDVLLRNQQALDAKLERVLMNQKSLNEEIAKLQKGNLEKEE